MTAAISVRDLTFCYNDAPVLTAVNIDIETGEFMGIIGPNGGGKSTLLKLLLGLLQPDAGTIRILGKSPKESLESIGYVPQHPRFDRSFPISVLELVLMGRLKWLPWWGSYCKQDHDLAQEALREVGIENLADRALGTLSGGQMQRALIARALASKPKILLLDEPTASVDKDAEGQIFSLLKNLSQDITIILVTHDLKTAVQMVDRIICVERTASTFKASEVCEHFALGLYHAPLLIKDTENCRLQIKKD